MITIDGQLLVGPPQPQFLEPPKTDGLELVLEPPEVHFLVPPIEDGTAIIVPVGGPPGPPGPAGPMGPEADVALSLHVNSETPHPVYDDGPSLALIYENKKV